MDKKTLDTLEYPKILAQLAGYCAFPPSAEKALGLHPESDLFTAQTLLDETAEVVGLFEEKTTLTVGGVRDIREALKSSQLYAVLEPEQFLDIKYTLASARTLRRKLEKLEDAPRLQAHALRLPHALGLVDAISKTISERGDVLDTASPKLAKIRKDLHIHRNRLLSKLQSMTTDPNIAPLLQDALVTQRSGRYVIPLRAEFKGKMRAIIHDQSSSGATLFVEPTSVVELNNKFRESELAERDEVRRVLAELSARIAEHAPVLEEMVDALADLDLVIAKAHYAMDLQATKPTLIRKGKGSILSLIQARHPLIDPDEVVPIDVVFDNDINTIIITGPNTGGKTVVLKSTGLLAVMAYSGLLIPVSAESSLTVFTDIYADIGDEQSIEQSLSTFSSHITNIIRILEEADKTTLVLLDELGAGTDPQEGSALAQAILDYLLAKRIPSMVTTHHPELKNYAHITPRAINASVEFDEITLQPKYSLTIGLPGRSNALDIAKRLGMPGQIIEEARAKVNPQEIEANDLLADIHRQRDLADKALARARQEQQNAIQTSAALKDRLENIEQERKEILDGMHQSVKLELADIRSKIEEVHGELSKRTEQPAPINDLEELVDALEQEVEIAHPPEPLPTAVVVPEIAGELVEGATVYHLKLGKNGTIIGMAEDEVELLIGSLRIRSNKDEVRFVSAPASATPSTDEQGGSIKASKPTSPGIELDLRGKTADEALEMLETYLDRAYMVNLPWVRIIHGKGTGKLRSTVRESLQANAHVLSFESGQRTEGGDGVTIAKLVG